MPLNIHIEMHLSDNDNNDDDNNDNSNKYSSNSKASVFKHLKPEIKQQLQKHTWTPVSLSPLKLLIAIMITNKSFRLQLKDIRR